MRYAHSREQKKDGSKATEQIRLTGSAMLQISSILERISIKLDLYIHITTPHTLQHSVYLEIVHNLT